MSTDTPADRRSSGHGAKSAAFRDRAVVALLSERNLMAARSPVRCQREDAAALDGRGRAVKPALTEARTEMFQVAMDRVQVLTVEAIDTLAELMRKKTAPTVRLRGDSARADAAKCLAKDAPHRQSHTNRPRLFLVGRVLRGGEQPAMCLRREASQPVGDQNTGQTEAQLLRERRRRA